MRRLTFCAIFLCTCMPLHANVIQYFTGISYSNPAELFQVKKNQFILGATGFYTKGTFQGSALNFNTMETNYGSSYTRSYSVLPYGRVAHRWGGKWVFGVDVTEPVHSNLAWLKTAVTRYAGTENILRDVDVSPRFSWQILPQVYLGLGANFNFVNKNEGNWVMPTGRTTYENMINLSSSFNAGFDAGLYYTITQSDFFGAAYYSRIKQRTHGVSLLNHHANTDYNFTFNLPPTWLFNYVHLISKTWLINLRLIKANWSVNPYLYFNHTAGDPVSNFTFDMKFRPAWVYGGAIRHQLNDKWGVTLLGFFDRNPISENLRPINFPADNQYFYGLAVDRNITKQASVTLLLGRGFSDSKTMRKVNVQDRQYHLTDGSINIFANVLDLKLTITGD